MCEIDNKNYCWYEDLTAQAEPGCELNVVTPLLSLYAFEKLLPTLGKAGAVRLLCTGKDEADCCAGLWNDGNDAPKQLELKQRYLAASLLRLLKERKLFFRLSPRDTMSPLCSKATVDIVSRGLRRKKSLRSLSRRNRDAAR